MVNDSEWPLYPFYPSNFGLNKLKGPSTYQKQELIMTDRLFTYIGTTDPGKTENTLASSYRSTKFFLWCVFFDKKTFDFIILNSFEWGQQYLLEQTDKVKIWPHQYKFSNGLLRIPNCVYFPTHANGSQLITWQANDDETVIVVSPRNKLVFRFDENILECNNGILSGEMMKKLGYQQCPIPKKDLQADVELKDHRDIDFKNNL
jgi:hypothetical protein